MTGLVRFIQEKLGQPLYPGQVEILDSWAGSGKPNALFCVGRRSGKTMLAAGAAIFNATDPVYSRYLRPHEPREIVVVANSETQAGFFIRTVRTLLESPGTDPRLYNAVNWDACRLDLISFVDGVSIRTMPLSSRSTRGPACSMLIFDESGHFQTGGESIGEGNEVYQALAPTVAQFGDDGHILFTSTPKLRLGLFWEQYRNGTEGKDPKLFVVQRATWEISPNPNLTREKLEQAFPGRPEWVATEYGADFASAAGSFLNPSDVYECQRESGTLPPREGARYACAIDPAFQRDAFAMGIGHKDGDLIVIDGVWAWNQKGYDKALDEVADVAKSYGIRSTRSDQFAGQAIAEGLQKRGVNVDIVPWTNPQRGGNGQVSENKYDAYSRLKARLVSRRISIPRDDALATELVGLQQTTTISGVVRIAAPSGDHDDRASVVASLMAMLDGSPGVMAFTVDYDPDHGDVGWNGDPSPENWPTTDD